MGHNQTVQTLIRRRKMRCLSRIFTVCLLNVLLKFEEKLKNNTWHPLNWKWARLSY